VFAGGAGVRGVHSVCSPLWCVQRDTRNRDRLQRYNRYRYRYRYIETHTQRIAQPGSFHSIHQSMNLSVRHSVNPSTNDLVSQLHHHPSLKKQHGRLLPSLPAPQCGTLTDPKQHCWPSQRCALSSSTPTLPSFFGYVLLNGHFSWAHSCLVSRCGAQAACTRAARLPRPVKGCLALGLFGGLYVLTAIH
jgi:hypothetical protein